MLDSISGRKIVPEGEVVARKSEVAVKSYNFVLDKLRCMHFFHFFHCFFISWNTKPESSDNTALVEVALLLLNELNLNLNYEIKLVG
jgi:hypothetical protein